MVKWLQKRDELKWRRIGDGGKAPQRGTHGSVGFDLYSPKDFTIQPKSTLKIPLAIGISPPKGYYARTASRSGLAAQYQLFVTADVIDPDYTGEIHVILCNVSESKYSICRGDRIGQLVLTKYKICHLKEVNGFPKTDRAAKGFGSTDQR